MDLFHHLNNLDLGEVERAIAVRAMGADAKRLHDEGYAADADRVLDELSDLLKQSDQA